jgi:hypothetical protein
MASITTHFDITERPYTELYGHFAFKNFGIAGDAAVAFVGPCDVEGERLVDLEDRRAGDTIKAARMLHFVVEHFGVPLAEAVWRQRLFAAIVCEEVSARAPEASVRREGDDIFADDGKLTVSIATVSPTSAVVHFGVNVDGAGAPVTVTDLQSLGIDAREMALAVLSRYAAEVESARAAVCKVKGVC